MKADRNLPVRKMFLNLKPPLNPKLCSIISLNATQDSSLKLTNPKVSFMALDPLQDLEQGLMKIKIRMVYCLALEMASR